MTEKIGHSADGIEEYNTPIPRWLMWLLYSTIIIAVVYLILYPGFWRGLSGWSSAEMYEREMEESGARYEAMKPAAGDIYVLIESKQALHEGEEIFLQNCAPCHGADATGVIGPNLTDEGWIYGGKPEQIVHTVTNGTEKGMPAWGSQLGDAKIAQVAAYVYSLGIRQ